MKDTPSEQIAGQRSFENEPRRSVRARKVTSLLPQHVLPPAKTRYALPSDGKGIALKQFPRWRMASTKVCIHLHRVLLGRPGTKRARKKALQNFRGFSGSSSTRGLTTEKLAKKFISVDREILQETLRLFKLPVMGTKEEQSLRMGTFLMSPSPDRTTQQKEVTRKTRTPPQKGIEDQPKSKPKNRKKERKRTTREKKTKVVKRKQRKTMKRFPSTKNVAAISLSEVNQPVEQSHETTFIPAQGLETSIPSTSEKKQEERNVGPIETKLRTSIEVDEQDKRNDDHRTPSKPSLSEIEPVLLPTSQELVSSCTSPLEIVLATPQKNVDGEEKTTLDFLDGSLQSPCAAPTRGDEGLVSRSTPSHSGRNASQTPPEKVKEAEPVTGSLPTSSPTPDSRIRIMDIEIHPCDEKTSYAPIKERSQGGVMWSTDPGVAVAPPTLTQTPPPTLPQEIETPTLKGTLDAFLPMTTLPKPPVISSMAPETREGDLSDLPQAYLELYSRGPSTPEEQKQGQEKRKESEEQGKEHVSSPCQKAQEGTNPMEPGRSWL